MLVFFALAFLGSCGGDVRRFETPDVSGPPSVRLDVVDDHAEQFDTDVPERPPGSEEEQAAAAYILGTLQQNGYFARLEAVPVADLVRSTNVIAEPSGADVPQAMVVVPYGTVEGDDSNGEALGLFLELARAVNVAEPQHAVHFTAVGAAEAQLGARRLARLLLDEERDPFIVELVSGVQGFVAEGDRSEELAELAGEAASGGSLPERTDVFGAAGFEHVVVGGDVEVVGDVLVRFLSSFQQ